MSLSEKVTSAQADLDKLVADLRTLLASKELEAVPEISTLRQRAEDHLGQARETVVRAANEAAWQAREKAAAADRYAHDEPWRVAGAALAVGALLGAMVGAFISRR